MEILPVLKFVRFGFIAYEGVVGTLLQQLILLMNFSQFSEHNEKIAAFSSVYDLAEITDLIK